MKKKKWKSLEDVPGFVGPAIPPAAPSGVPLMLVDENGEKHPVICGGCEKPLLVDLESAMAMIASLMPSSGVPRRILCLTCRAYEIGKGEGL